MFAEGADYITPISEAIKEQMQAQMDADENVYYWLDDEIEEWNFKSVTDETSFYINETAMLSSDSMRAMWLPCIWGQWNLRYLGMY